MLLHVAILQMESGLKTRDLLDAAYAQGFDQDERDLADYLLSRSDDDAELTYLLCVLLVDHRFEAAAILARRQLGRGLAHPGIFLAQAVGGLLQGRAVDLAAGRAALHVFVSAFTAEQQALLYTTLVQPIFPQLLARTFLGNDHAATLQLLEILTAASPSLRPVFDLAGPVAPLDIDAMRRRGAARARLIDMPAGPCPPSRPRRAVVAMREKVFPNKPASRPNEIGPRVQASLAACGWPASLLAMHCHAPMESDYQALVTLCETERAEILVLDEQMVQWEAVRPARAAALARLRRTLPSLRIVALYMDPWYIDPAILREAAAAADLIWSTSPEQPIWQEESLARKCWVAPFPHASNHDLPQRPLRPAMFFSGGIQAYNWHRAFWVVAASAAGLPIQTRLSGHESDGLSALESSAVYLHDLAEATCALNLSMRPDLSRIVTGRCFETCLAGSLLVQEATPDMDHYFVAGEHYLEFTTFAELRAITRFLAERPGEAEAVRRRGNAFALARYRDENIVASLDRQLALQEAR